MDHKHSRLLTLVALFLILFFLVALAYFWRPNYTLTVPPPEPFGHKRVSVLTPLTTDYSAPALKREPVLLAAVGDIMLSRVVADKIKKNGNDYPFIASADWLRTADIVFGNLETPLTPGRRILTGEMVFRSDPVLAQAMKENNFSILSLANNHTMNFGQEGMVDTLNALKAVDVYSVGAGVDYTEANSAVYIEVKGRRFAFLAYNDNDVVPAGYGATSKRAGTAFMDTEVMSQSVARAKQEADFVIVSMHSGIEYEKHHSLRQENFAHSAINAGADLVIGHHPHVIQDVEVYKGKYIFYSLGNFIFDQMFSEETRLGLGVIFSFDDSGLFDISFQPFKIVDYAQPQPLYGEEAQIIIDRLGLNKEINFIDR